MDTAEKIRESNRIERIYRDPTPQEIAEYERFMKLKTVTVSALQRFVEVYAPGHVLREKSGQDVIIGGRLIEGGPQIRSQLETLLVHINAGQTRPYLAHMQYEMVHPFTDGNGRSGRMLWYWQMEALNHSTDLGFLHSFYYQALQAFDRACRQEAVNDPHFSMVEPFNWVKK